MPLLRALPLLFTATRSQVRLLQMIGFGLASLGAVALLVGAVLILRAMRSRNGAQRSHRTLERVFQVAGFGLIAMGLVAKTLAEIGRVVGR